MGYIAGMRLFINGEEKTFTAVSRLPELIDQMGMKGDRVAVELIGDTQGRRICKGCIVFSLLAAS